MSKGEYTGVEVPNEQRVDYDKAGYCSLCHIPVAEFNGSLPNGSVRIEKLLGNFDQITLLLDDNSLMDVVMCKPCKEKFKPEEAQELMESIINGWTWEAYHLLNGWGDEKTEKHLLRYSKREILTRADRPWGIEQVAKIKPPRLDKLSSLPAKVRDELRKKR